MFMLIEKSLFKIPDEPVLHMKNWLNKNPPMIITRRIMVIDILGKENLVVETWFEVLSLDISSSEIKIPLKYFENRR